MDYIESRQYIKAISKYGSVLGLDSIKELLRRLNNPQNNLKVVHFAGTNGKGSTITYTESILLTAGYKVGKYMSPAVFDYLEIFQINGRNISEEEYAECMTKIKETATSMAEEGKAHPTAFEVETALAFLFFERNDCDIVLLETGMGGETDATNVMERVLCSVITSVSLDHTQFLGETLSEIATVKAGIIKKECPVVVLRQDSEVIEAIDRVAKHKQADMIITEEPENIYTDDLKYITFDYNSVSGEDSEKWKFDEIHTKMKGSYQPENATVAIEVMRILKKQGFDVESHIKSGIERAEVAGRFEVICDSPAIIIDGAHNPGAAYKLKDSLQMYFTNKRIAIIMGVLADKDYDKVAKILAPLAEKIITVSTVGARGLDAEQLKNTIEHYNKDVLAAESVEDALEMSINMVKQGRTDLILACGSLSYLGELKRLVKQKC